MYKALYHRSLQSLVPVTLSLYGKIACVYFKPALSRDISIFVVEEFEGVAPHQKAGVVSQIMTLLPCNSIGFHHENQLSYT